MSPSGTPTSSRQGLETLRDSRSVSVTDRAPLEDGIALATAEGQLSLPLANTSAPVSPQIKNNLLVDGEEIGLDALTATPRENINAEEELNDGETDVVKHQARRDPCFKDLRPQTRATVARRRDHYLRVHFNLRFRSLPSEVQDMIFCLAIKMNCSETPAVVIGLRTNLIHSDGELYQAALRAFCVQNTFVLSRQNSYVIDQGLKGAMSPAIWLTVRNLEIRHDYLGFDQGGSPRRVFHGNDRGLLYRYSPCPMCSQNAILLAQNVRNLHLNFGDSYHVAIPFIERTCKLAIDHLQLGRLVLTLSNIWSPHIHRFLGVLIESINQATQETGRLLSVGTKAISRGPYSADFATQSWFWDSTGGRRSITWVSNWVDKRADDAAELRRLYGPVGEIGREAAVGNAPADLSTPADAPAHAGAGAGDDAEEAGAGDAEGDLSDVDENQFPDWVPTP